MKITSVIRLSSLNIVFIMMMMMMMMIIIIIIIINNVQACLSLQRLPSCLGGFFLCVCRFLWLSAELRTFI